jgi:hypothetical protein
VLTQEINDNCCNGGSGGGHRRAQACDLSVCTAACAAIFLPVWPKPSASIQYVLALAVQSGLDGSDRVYHREASEVYCMHAQIFGVRKRNEQLRAIAKAKFYFDLEFYSCL